MNYIEHQDITLEMIIKAGLLPAGIKVYSASDSNIFGVLNVDGSITLNIEGNQKVFPYPSGAARAIRNVSVNGWLFWGIIENDQFVELSKVKKRYFEQISDNPSEPVNHNK